MTFVRINGAGLYSEVEGAGDPVLLLHGGFCSLESLRSISDALVPDRQIFAFERPGHGRSADIEGGYSYEAGVRDALAYLDAQGLESAHVIGYSDGGIIGLMLAMDHPERVRSLVAVSANLDPTAFTHSPEGDDAPRLSALAPSADPKPDVERMHYDRLSPDGPGHADAVLAKLFRLWTSEPQIDPAGLAGITAPTLIMSGDRDTIRPDHSLLIAASIPGAQLCIVPGTSHGLVGERPELIASIIRAFLP
ncbi:pimeloyl-ACP methyl ester carboxylesterase [Arthrobacter stackebrandtii]|uniref:Pimeloyl-ACP methyl ester carboxylesterase n=1 Tax=Arthrobacter stackebrandtii TaxID=272161 RepID=A0ABS4Z022_9MICC|nr:alpha/beta hydrolase [Arthrobacter stackebrandtii]MBP2414057.1 pimeloyl-ACP methyl ester carboxylesterase [Arthrobacter stackebrandtii]PYG99392.1 alpha/beta hydrolase [Arthrobacter stackebrandtii]